MDPRSMSECSFDSSTTFSTRMGQLSAAASGVGDESSGYGSSRAALVSIDQSVGTVSTHVPFHIFDQRDDEKEIIAIDSDMSQV